MIDLSRTKNRNNELLERIAVESKNSKLSNSNLKNISVEIQELATHLEISHVQVVLLAIVIKINLDERSCDLSDIAKYIGLDSIEMLDFLVEFNALKKKRLIMFEKKNIHYKTISNISFEVNIAAIDRISLGLDNTDHSELSFLEFINTCKTFYGDLENNVIDKEMLDDIIKEIIAKNKHLKICSIIEDLYMPIDHAHVFLAVTIVSITDDYCSVDEACKMPYPDDEKNMLALKMEVMNERLNIFRLDLVQMAGGDFMSNNRIELSEKGRKEVLGEYELLIDQEHIRESTHVERYNSIKSKKLFFNQKNEAVFNKLRGVLQEKNYKNIRNRLELSKMPLGMCILLHGLPGTGKTESVYQLARLSKRDILPVEVNEIKDKWFGESEKLVKRVFDRYKRIASKLQRAPILLFNEADAIFSKRMDVSVGTVKQTENAIQNIILQEMEKFDGVLIATTNLTQNFDPAFERRFLFKVEYEKPDLESKVKIWKSKVKGLRIDIARKLAERYDFSGGQIENVARKYFIDYLLDGRKLSFEYLNELCEAESLHQDNRGNKIGFKF